MSILLLNGDALQIPLADESVHVVCTSPPYWGLRDYGVGDQLGLEETPEQHVKNMVRVFREVRRVLRSDGTLWLNYGDSYASQPSWGRGGGLRVDGGQPYSAGVVKNLKGLKPLDLCNIPHRVAAALQADGWYWRSTIVWHKPNPMPESQNGWRWERCRVKVGKIPGTQFKNDTNRGSHDVISGGTGEHPAWADCPGCDKCAPNDGLVLRRGNWRPTTSHEYIFLMAKSTPYFCDADAVRQPLKDSPEIYMKKMGGKAIDTGTYQEVGAGRKEGGFNTYKSVGNWGVPAGRNARTVWQIATQPYPGSHFATFPVELPRRCIKAGTSEAGVCGACGSPWARVVGERSFVQTGGNKGKKRGNRNPHAGSDMLPGRTSYPTLGFRPTCTCTRPEWFWCPDCDITKFIGELAHGCPSCLETMIPAPERAVPAVVLDPFAGSGTVGLAARELGQHFIGLDLSYSYLYDQARKRLSLDALRDWERGKDGKTELTDLPLFGGHP